MDANAEAQIESVAQQNNDDLTIDNKIENISGKNSQEIIENIEEPTENENDKMEKENIVGLVENDENKVEDDKTPAENVENSTENDETPTENAVKENDENLTKNVENSSENVKDNAGDVNNSSEVKNEIPKNEPEVFNAENLSKNETKMEENSENVPTKNEVELNDNVEESDGEIVDDSDNEAEQKVAENKVDYSLDVPAELDQLDYDEDSDDNMNSAVQNGKTSKMEKQQEIEMSEGEIESSDGELKSDKEDNNQNISQIGFYPDEREDGEMVDPMEGPAVPREICRFFERGSCTWGDRCRFIHPGINDKGEYRMFDDGREAKKPVVEEKSLTPAIDPREFPPNFMDGPPQMETPWERGLRYAKEMRKRSMQRKVEEPDFMRKREIISTNEALNVDRDMDYIAHKPLVDDMRGYDPFADLESDERYAVPPPEVLKKLKRFERREERRSPGRGDSPSRRRGFPPPMGHNNRRRSPPRPNMHPQHRDIPPYMRQPNFMERGPPNMRDRMEGKPGMEHRRSPDFRRREVESRIIPAQRDNKSPRQQASQPLQQRGDNWQDPWARGRQKERSKSNSSSSGSSSSGSSSRSSNSSRSSSFSSRSSSRSSFSSSFSDSNSSRSGSPEPVKVGKKVLKKKKNQDAKNVPATKKNVISKIAPAVKPASPKKSPKAIKPQPVKQPTKPVVPEAKKKVVPKTKAKERGRTKTKTKRNKSDSSSTSEFSHSSSSSRSRSRSKSESGSGSSSSSGSDSSSSSGSSSEDESATKKNVKAKAKPSKVSVPSKPGGKNVKMTIINKPKVAAKGAPTENRKRTANQMSNQPPKIVSAIANRRVELLEQLKVVENAILKKRAKLT